MWRWGVAATCAMLRSDDSRQENPIRAEDPWFSVQSVRGSLRSVVLPGWPHVWQSWEGPVPSVSSAILKLFPCVRTFFFVDVYICTFSTDNVSLCLFSLIRCCSAVNSTASRNSCRLLYFYQSYLHYKDYSFVTMSAAIWGGMLLLVEDFQPFLVYHLSLSKHAREISDET